MTDVKVSIVAIDSAMDCFERIGESVSTYQRIVLSNLSELRWSIEERIRSINRKIEYFEDELHWLNDDEWRERRKIRVKIRKLEEQLSGIESLLLDLGKIEKQYRDGSKAIVCGISTDVASGMEKMAAYLRKINDIADGGSGWNQVAVANVFTGECNYVVVMIDSNKYPESAAHIRKAIHSGHPAILTLNRSGAEENRRQSLSNFRILPFHDRDEYPPASFVEGGEGADIAYIDPSDNRGSGSSFRWQLRKFPDGTRVKFRVV